MATFELTGPDGGKYHVDAPDEGAAVAAFSAFNGGKPAAPPPDKYQQAAIDEQAALKKAGGDEGAGFTRRLAHGATMGADSTILAGLEAIPEAIKHAGSDLGSFDIGKNFSALKEGYNYAKAREDQIMGDARKNTGTLGNATELLGGAVTGGNVAGGVGGLARGAGGELASAPSRALSFGANLGPDAGLVARSAASAGDAAAMGGVSGAMEGNGLEERLTNAAKGAGTGLAVGGALPGALTLASAAARPITSNLRALINPEGFGQSQVARAIHESGQTPAQLGQAVADANAAGQPFTLADALGNPGQKMLATAARGPGEANTEITNFLNNRQSGQGGRVVNALEDGFGSRMTPAQLEEGMTAARGAQADAEYGAVRHDAQPVDVSDVIDHIDATLKPLGVPLDRVTTDGITGSMQRYRNMLGGKSINLDGSAAGGVNDFNAAQMVRSELSDEVNRAVRAGENDKARRLGGVLRRLDTSLENSSAGFKQANANFAQNSRNIEAIGTGQQAFQRGRTADVLSDFNSLQPRGQQGFRTGFVDPAIQKVTSAADGVNKARPFLNDRFRDIADATAPANTQLQRQLSRENTMFETRNRALGNSKTAENLADDAALGVDPHLVGNVLTGNWHGALRSVLQAGHTALTGNTPAVRAAVGRMLLDRGVNPANLNQAIGHTVARIQFMQQLARSVGRAGSGALAVSRPGQT